jgi:hypothetical protein
MRLRLSLAVEKYVYTFDRLLDPGANCRRGDILKQYIFNMTIFPKNSQTEADPWNVVDAQNDIVAVSTGSANRLYGSGRVPDIFRELRLVHREVRIVKCAREECPGVFL